MIETLKELLEDMKNEEITADNLLFKNDDGSLRKISTIEDYYSYNENYEGDARQSDDYNGGRGRGRQDYHGGGRGRRGNYGGGRGRLDNYGSGRGRRDSYGDGRGRQDNNGGGRDHQDMEITNKENANCVMMEAIASQHGRGLDVWKFTK